VCVWCVCSCFRDKIRLLGQATYVALTPKLLPGNTAIRSERSVSSAFRFLSRDEWQERSPWPSR